MPPSDLRLGRAPPRATDLPAPAAGRPAHPRAGARRLDAHRRARAATPGVGRRRRRRRARRAVRQRPGHQPRLGLADVFARFFATETDPPGRLGSPSSSPSTAPCPASPSASCSPSCGCRPARSCARWPGPTSGRSARSRSSCSCSSGSTSPTSTRSSRSASRSGPSSSPSTRTTWSARWARPSSASPCTRRPTRRRSSAAASSPSTSGQLEAAAALGIPRLPAVRAGSCCRRRCARSCRTPPTRSSASSRAPRSSPCIAIRELFYQVQVIYGRNGRVVPLLMVATVWYIILTTLLSDRPVLRRTPLRPRQARACRRHRCSAAARWAGSHHHRSPGDATTGEGPMTPWSISWRHKSFGPTGCCDGVDLELRRGRSPSSSARPARASPRCCAPSTTWRRSTAARSASTARSSATAGSGDKLYELRERDILRQRTRIGFVFQNFNLFPHLTVLENIVEAPVSAQRRQRHRRSSRRGREQLLERVGLADKAAAYPQAALRRSAAARRHRPRARPGAEAAALRRADVRARPRAGRRGPRRHQGPRRDRAPR